MQPQDRRIDPESTLASSDRRRRGKAVAPALDDEAIATLVVRWLKVAWSERARRSRAPVDAQLVEAQKLAGLLEELPPCGLLPPGAGAELRALSLVTRHLEDQVQRLRSDRRIAQSAERDRAEAREWIRLVVETLRFVRASGGDFRLAGLRAL